MFHGQPALVIIIAIIIRAGLGATAHAAVVSHPVSFAGASQTLSLDVKVAGKLAGAGSGTLFGVPFALDPNPQSVDFHLAPEVVHIDSHPVTMTPGARFDINDQTGQLVGIRGISLDALNGVTAPFTTSTVNITALLQGQSQPVIVDGVLTGKVLGLTVDQTSESVVTGNKFTLSGNTHFSYQYRVDLLGGLLNVIPPSSDTLYGSGSLVTGTSTATPVPGHPRDLKIALDATASLQGNLSYKSFAISTMIGTQIGFTGSASLPATIFYNATVHLEAIVPNAVVPEPGSVALLFIGLFVVGASLVKRPLK